MRHEEQERSIDTQLDAWEPDCRRAPGCYCGGGRPFHTALIHAQHCGVVGGGDVEKLVGHDAVHRERGLVKDAADAEQLQRLDDGPSALDSEPGQMKFNAMW